MNEDISKKVVSLFFLKTQAEIRKELNITERQLRKYIDINQLRKNFFMNEEEKGKAKELALEGKTLEYIAKDLGYSIRTVFVYLKSQDISTQKIKEKRDLEVIKRDNLSDSQKAKILNISYQNYYATKKRLQKKGLI